MAHCPDWRCYGVGGHCAALGGNTQRRSYRYRYGNGYVSVGWRSLNRPAYCHSLPLS